MKLVRAFLAVALLIAGCGDASPDVLSEVQAARGFLDCPSDLVQYSTADLDVNAAGSATANAALDLLTPDLGLPPGVASVETQGGNEVVYLFSDSDGHRLGRVVVSRPGSGGWFVMSTERCG